MTLELLNAYRFHRSTTRAARRYALPSPNSAWDALNLARRDVETGKSRYSAPEPGYLSRQEGGMSHASKPECFGLRHVGDVTAETYGGRDCWNRRGEHGGWYTDPYGDVMKDGTGLCWGVVYQLPGRDGKARFVAGYQHGGTDDGPCLDLSQIFESDPSESGPYDTDARDLQAAREAAFAANAMASHAAEEECDYQKASAAGSRYADLGGDIADARKACLAVLRERRAVAWSTDDGKPPKAICAAIRDRVADYVREITDARQKRAKLAAGDLDPLIFYPDARLKAAFNASANEAVLT